VAAKLSALREPPYYSFVTSAVHSIIPDNLKFSADGTAMWERRVWDEADGVNGVYRSSWWAQP